METKHNISTRRLYIEKQNPIFIILTILPLVLSIVTFAFGVLMKKVGFGIFGGLGIAAGACYFLPWAMLNYWKNRKAYPHNAAIMGVFVLNIISLLSILMAFIFYLGIDSEAFIAFISISMLANLVMLIMGLSFTGCNTRAHIAKVERKKRERAVKLAQSITRGKRSWVTTFVLCALLGIFGAHRMYVGKKTYGILTLVLSLLGIGLIVFFIPWIVDFAKILCHSYKDKSGNIVNGNITWVSTLVLCILFGIFGAHRMYVGKKTYGILTLVLSLLGIGLIVFFIPWIVDFAKILCHTYKNKAGKVVTDL